MSNQLQTIDPAALAQVSGGTTVTTNTGTSNDQILTSLNGILNSIQSLAQPNSGGLNQTEMLMLLMIMQQRNQVAVAPANPWAGWGQPPIYYY